MGFPTLSDARRLERLRPPSGKVRMVLDTDTYNEIDDQFAVVHALLSPERLSVEAIYAAPFFNPRSSGPADGMEKSYDEILRVLARLGVAHEGFAFRGSAGYLPGRDQPRESDAAKDLVAKALRAGGDEPLYVVAVGAITNVASAILLEPAIIERIVVVWLGGQPLHWPTAREFNLQQDLHASRLILDCGVPLVQIPCSGVSSHLLTTVAEIERYVAGQGAIGDYLADIFKAYHADHFAWSKVIWDIAGIAWLLDGSWVPTELVHSPILTDQVTWSEDRSRHFVRFATHVRRDPVFRDLFTKLARRATASGEAAD
ncbi:MAG TPA: nucleoside hydrolase [Planctomycetota bacterium]|nr:nucleoside hydrolase [Planctomycetota bacterium]HRR80571.1 nucleoside hydrolase [Planctomycetota bacterium]HRT97518.1 nucleoside hydrolase [Planctomycetota bacterium]